MDMEAVRLQPAPSWNHGEEKCAERDIDDVRGQTTRVRAPSAAAGTPGIA